MQIKKLTNDGLRNLFLINLNLYSPGKVLQVFHITEGILKELLEMLNSILVEWSI